MTYREALSQRMVAVSTSESPDMPALGLSDQHLRDAMTEIARHLLALGARLAYGGDMREHGFTELLFELLARHRRDADEGDENISVLNYLAWPVHILKTVVELDQNGVDLTGSAALVFLGLDGKRITKAERSTMASVQPIEAEWATGLTSMRQVMRDETDARIALGGRVDRYKGCMPGIAEESLLSLQAKQPLFLLGGFGGCARDIAEILGVVAPRSPSQPTWAGRELFDSFTAGDLNNGLTAQENAVLAKTPHTDQAVALILRGLLRQGQTPHQR